jgi:Spy/CpxP family protein refolding chaperone
MARRHSRLVISAAVAALIAAGAVLYAQGPGPGGRPGRGPGGTGVGSGATFRGLNLSDTQRQQMRDLADQHRDALRAAADRVRTARDAQQAALATIPVNEGQVRATTQALAEAQTELALEQARLRGEAFALLTPEQQAEAQKLQAERQTRQRARRDRLQQRLQDRRQDRQRQRG